MKKHGILLLACVLTAMLLFTLTASADYYYYPMGDVDSDGAVSSADARIVLRASVQLDPIAEEDDAFYFGDVDYDGRLTSADARLILRASVGLEELLEFGTIVESTPAFRLGMNHWEWNVDDDGDPYVDIIFVAQNTSDQVQEYNFFDWGVNEYMVETYFPPYIEEDYFILNPGEWNYMVERCYCLVLPPDYSIAPTGQIAFTYSVENRKESGGWYEWEQIAYGTRWFYDESLSEYAFYTPPYPDRAFPVTKQDCRYMSLDRYLADTYYPDDTLVNRLFFQNTSNRDQSVSITLEAVNGRSALISQEEGYPVNYFTVYAGYSSILTLELPTNPDDPYSTWTLDRLGIDPKDVYSLRYTVRVYDYETGDLIVSTTTTSTVT